MTRMRSRLTYFTIISSLLLLGALAHGGDAANDLLVQTALHQGKESLARGEYGQAVRVLEPHLAKINGNAAYLELLEDAYRGYVKELSAKGETELAMKFHQKLAILDKGAKLETAVRPVEVNPPREIIRAKIDDSPTPHKGESIEEILLAAEREFRAQSYEAADALYRHAFQLDGKLSTLHRERWAYAKLSKVADMLNANAQANWADLEKEARFALELAPRLDFGKPILDRIAEHAKPVDVPAKSAVEIRHLPGKSGAWQACESPNFRVLHQDRKLAEQVATVAEQSRAAVLAKWVGDKNPPAWRIRCDIYLHATAADYNRATQAPAESPGHSTMDIGPNGVESRRIDLHVDEPRMLAAVLPHETTHCTVADQFGAKPIPRWADEGMAVLSEPPQYQQRVLSPFVRARQEGRVFTAKQLMALDQYPERRMMEPFYAQSAMLVGYLAELGGPLTFGKFLKDAQSTGYESALTKHYPVRGMDEFQKQWEKHIAAVMDGASKPAVADRN